MRKLPSALENPVDNVLIDLAEAVSPWLRRAGQTPNMLTTYSVMSGGVALWALWNDNIAAFATCWAMRVFWDTADGSFARSYGMETRLGDAYDHANDVLSNLALLATMPKARHMPPVDGLDCRPQALILFSALVNTTAKGQGSNRFPHLKTAKALSPSQLVRRKLPPMLFFHGKSDRITPFDEVERFCRRMRWRGNSCELVDFVREDHSFFNFNVSQKNFELTIGAADRFLVDRGVLPPETTT